MFTAKQGKYVDIAIAVLVLIAIKYSFEAGMKEEKLAKQQQTKQKPIASQNKDIPAITLLIYDSERFKRLIFKPKKVPTYEPVSNQPTVASRTER